MNMIHDLKIVFAQNWPAVFVLALTGATLASVVFFYRRVSDAPPRTLRILMFMRAGAMFLLLLCLFRPVVAFHRRAAIQSELLFLVDKSLSMTVRDHPDQPDRFRRVHAALFRPGTALSELEREFAPAWYVFDADAQPLRSKRELDRVVPDGGATLLAQAVRTALRDRNPEDVAGVILVTDGIDNSGRDPVPEIAALQAPVFPVAVGARLLDQPDFKDIRIVRVDAPREAALNSTAEVRVHVDAVGYPNRAVPVILYEDDREMDRRELVLDNVVGAQTVVLRYRPKEKGEFELRVAIPPEPDERIEENNEAAFPVHVAEPRIKALYIEGALRQEYREIRRALQFDPHIELMSFIRTAPEGLLFLQQGHATGVRLDDIPTTADQLADFDVLILGSVDHSLLAAKRLRPEEIKAFVERGGGFLAIGGLNAFGPGGYTGSAIEEVLPVFLGGRDAGQEEAPFHMRLTPAGRTHPVFAGYEGFFAEGDERADMEELQLQGCNVVERAKPGATVLAVNPRRANEHGPLTVLAVQPFGRGRAAALTIDSTWRWYRPLRGMGKQSPFVRFWGQLVRWLAGMDQLKRTDEAGLVAYADKHIYEAGEPVRFFARVTDKEGNATPHASVQLELLREGDESPSPPHSMPYVEGTFGDYELELGDLAPGRYEASVSAAIADPLTREQDPLGEPVSLTFLVSRPMREFEELDANEALLDRIADATGGARYTLLSIDQLAHDIRRRRREAGVYAEWPTWGPWTLSVPFAAVVLLLGGEWVFRKRRHLV